MFERLPVPFGLVRYGVAPDHARIKSVSQVFDRVAESDRFQFFGNVTVGQAVSVSRLSAHYSATIIAVGASEGRRLGIEGENLDGVVQASDFVGWYNGHPDRCDLPIALKNCRHVVIVGQGNVACDVARILSVPPQRLASTDIASIALQQLSESAIRDIRMIGRRGPAQLKITPAEMRELCSIEELKVSTNFAEIELNKGSRIELDDPRNESARNVVRLLQRIREVDEATNYKKTLHVDFLQSPVVAQGNGRVETLQLQKNILQGAPFDQRALPTGDTRTVPCDLLVLATGYRALAPPGVPFNMATGFVPNEMGNVLAEDGRPIKGLYVVGWIKRGPVGTIGTTRADSIETVDRMLADFSNGYRFGLNTSAFVHELRQVAITVDWERWRRIDVHERTIGELRGKPREKLTSIVDMLSI